jgi:hypothetical protein
MAFLLINRVLVTAFSAKTPPRMGRDGGSHGVGRDAVVIALVETDSEMLAPMARVENCPRAGAPIAVNSLDRGKHSRVRLSHGRTVEARAISSAGATG